MFDPNAHMMNLKGRQYLEVKWRLVWFREDHPDWNIDTQLIEHEPGTSAVFAAKIYDSNGMQKSSGFGSETVKDFRDYLEKAESKAVGRALAMLGYGTQFASELDEDGLIVDAPVTSNGPVCERCGKAIKPFTTSEGVVSPESYARLSMAKRGEVLCPECCKK